MENFLFAFNRNFRSHHVAFSKGFQFVRELTERMKLLEYFLISAFFSTAFCYSSLFFAAFEDVAAHVAATNYDIVVTNCADNDEVFKSVMNALMTL